jgi:hypothetical protein
VQAPKDSKGRRLRARAALPVVEDNAEAMPLTDPHRPDAGVPTAYFRSGDLIRSRSVSAVVLAATVELPALPARLLADCEREIAARLELEAGDVEPLSLARARARWPDCAQGVQAMSDWTHSLGLAGLLPASELALMACRGARYHHDAAQYGAAAFCNLFLCEDKDLDLHFPAAGRRIPLVRGTAVLFDTGQPHAVVRRGSSGFDAADFAPGRDCTQLFLSWELPIEEARVARALGITFDVDPQTASQLNEEQVRLDGAPGSVCPDSGRWCGPCATAAQP